MVDRDGDGIDDALEGAVRTTLMVAARIAERLVRLRQNQLQAAAAESAQRAREVQARYDVERALARAELAPVGDQKWLAAASPADLGRMYETAASWAPLDADAEAARTRIAEHAKQAYRVDLGASGAAPVGIMAQVEIAASQRALAAANRAQAEQDAVAARLLLAEAAEMDRFAAESRDRAVELERGVDWERADPVDMQRFEDAEAARAEADVQERTAAANLPQAAHLYETAANHREQATDRDRFVAAAEQQITDAGARYDSNERRAEFAKSMESTVDAGVIRGRMLADLDQGRHPSEAVQAAPARAPKARRTRGSTGKGASRGVRSL